MTRMTDPSVPWLAPLLQEPESNPPMSVYISYRTIKLPNSRQLYVPFLSPRQ